MTSPGELFDLSGRTAIVTGASSGLGRRFVEVLHDAGANVVATARRADRLAEVTEERSRSLAVPADLSDPDDRRRIVEAAVDAFGRVDVLVNNAGISGPSVSARDLGADRWATTMRVNLDAPFDLAQRVGRLMLDQGSGSIINVASILGIVSGVPFTDAAYAASKGAVVNLTRELGAEWGRRGVRVNAIAPGWFLTEMTEGMDARESAIGYVRNGCPMGRMGELHELDGVLLLLASDASTYCTGQTFAIDGGWTAR